MNSSEITGHLYVSERASTAVTAHIQIWIHKKGEVDYSQNL